jgi:PDZ domain-containing protein
MSNVDTPPPNVPLPPSIPTAPAAEPARRRRLHPAAWAAIVVGVAVVIAVVAAAVVHVPYVTLAPGSTYSTEERVEIEGAATYPASGEVVFTTVSIDDTVTVFEAVDGWRDDAVTVVDEEQFFQGQTREDNERYNQVAMQSAKDDAVLVALRKLGYAITEHNRGAQVISVEPGTPADAALLIGDVITAVDAQPVATADELIQAVGSHGPGDSIDVAVEDLNGKRSVQVVLAANPEDSSKGFLGIRTSTFVDYSTDVQVTIDSGRVGGPSAGLAFTLAILDLLTPGELTGGRVIACTGEITLDGAVGGIGGVAQKAVAVHRAGIEVFIVPEGNAAEARAHAPDGLTIVPVRTLDDALAYLSTIGGNSLALGQPGNTGDQGQPS